METGGGVVEMQQNGKACRRCKEHDATQKIRSEPVCDDCFSRYITTKTVKRLEALNRETRSFGRPSRKRYLAGLSFGPSSSALVRISEQNIVNQLAKQRDASFGIHIVHVDTDLSGSAASVELLERWKDRFPRFTFEVVSLTTVLALDTIDWSALPQRNAQAEPAKQLQELLEELPSATSRADVLRLFVRHVLVRAAYDGSYDALLLGHSTTSLAELTLSETAKGRGFSLPWQTNDGPQSILRYPVPGGEGRNDDATRAKETAVLVYYPVRELFRKELGAYNRIVRPPLTDLVRTDTETTGSVVSHRDVSIEEVMRRYFEEVEENYPSVVANVVRTTARLRRHDGTGTCHFCNTPLDEQGDERWRGELGDEEDEQIAASTGKLCYGCKRTFHG